MKLVVETLNEASGIRRDEWDLLNRVLGELTKSSTDRKLVKEFSNFLVTSYNKQSESRQRTWDKIKTKRQENPNYSRPEREWRKDKKKEENMKLIKESVTLSTKGKKALKESFNKNSKKLNETWAGMNVIDDLVDRAKGYITGEDYSIESAIESAIDDGLIYTKDIIDLAEHYGYIDDSELIQKFYDDLYNDMYNELEDFEGDKEDGGDDEELEESLNEVLVDIDEDDLLELLMNRLKRWTDDPVATRLYEEMYQSYIDSGAFSSGKFDPMIIVDNDWINYCDVVEPGEENYEELLRLYQENGLGDVSTEDVGYSYIEAATEDNGVTYLLCRW